MDLLVTLAAAFVLALVLGFATHRLRLSPIVGYLLAGIVLSPHTSGLVADRNLAEQLSEVGVILLMFGVGLQFQVEELRAVKRIAIPGALLQSSVATLVGAGVMHLFGWTWAAGIVFGLALSVASTVVLLRVLADNGQLRDPAGHIAVGWLVVEDLLTVFVLVLLPVLFGAGAAGGLGGVAWALAVGAVKVGTLIAVVLVVGGWAVPRVFGYLAATQSRELFSLGVLALTLGIAVASARVFGVSMALGAFLAGMVVARSEFSLRAATDALPMRDAFGVLFFVAVGTLFDWRILWHSPVLLLSVLGVIVVGKPLTALGLAVVMRYPFRVALSVAVALGQIGEFSFILAALARQLGVLSGQAMDLLVAAAVVSITLNPLLYRAVEPVASWISRSRWDRWLNVYDRDGTAAARPDAWADSHRAVVVGYGPVGQTVCRLLCEHAIMPVVVEMDLAVVQQLRVEGRLAVYGDARQADTLHEAGIESASVLVLSASSISAGQELIRTARQLNARLQVLARTSYLREAPELRRAGADGVFTGEGEVALAITEFILDRFGATNQQIDRARDRVRREFFDQSAKVGPSLRLPPN